MRITGGVYGGRQVRIPRGEVRPTQDKVRAALFSILGGRVGGCFFLDLFAGSGAVGLEALSRGAGAVGWVERSRRVYRTVQENVAALNGTAGAATVGADRAAGGGLPDGTVFVVLDDAVRFVGRRSVPPADVIFADPPYDVDGLERWGERLLASIRDGNALKSDGIFIMEQSSREPLWSAVGWQMQSERVYGESRLAFYLLDVQ